MSFSVAKFKKAILNSGLKFGVSLFVGLIIPKFGLEGEIIDVNFSKISQLELFEYNHYAFRGDINKTIHLSTSINSDYNGSEVFNNGAQGNKQYLLFSPTDISARQWFLYDEDNTDQNISITISPYQALDPVYSTDLSTGDEFGYDISINDWNESIIGSPGDNTSLGSVYVFEINSSSHQLQKQKIVPILTAGESNRTKFGASITTFEAELLIGAPDANDFTGKVYHYNRGDGNYTFLNSLIDSNGSQDEQFGYALALSSNGNELFVSSPHLKNDGIGKVSQFSYDGTTWVQENQFWSSSDRNITGDSFGYDLSANGDFLVVGAPDAQVEETVSGLVYVFEKNESGGWGESVQILSPDFLSDGDEFGHRVEIVDDIIFVAAKYGDDENRSDVGLVYIFELENGLWVEKSTISPPNNYASQIFSHDISARENYLTIGTTGVGNGGLAYVYQMGQDGSEWDLVSTLGSTEVNSSNPSLFSIAMGKGQIIMGLPEDSEGQNLGGSIQTFINAGWQQERAQKFPPMITDPLIMDFLIEEDDVQGLIIDFNATHPFDSDLLWQIDGHDSNTGVLEFNNSSGLLSYFPAQDFNGNIALALTVSVVEGSLSENLTIEVLPVPDPPVFDDNTTQLPYAMVGDEYGFEINASDVDGDNLSFSLTPSNLGLSFVDNKLQGTPLQSAVGDQNFVDYSLLIEVSDGTLSTSKDFSIRIYQANTAPRFEDSAGNVLEELTLELEEDFSTSDWQQKLSGLVLSDDDPSNLWFSLSMESSPSKGIVFLDPNSTNNLFIDYQPALNFHGTDQFSVRLTDSNVPPKSSILSLNLNILPVNDPPVISSSPITQITEGEEYRYELSVYDPDLNDTHVFYEIQLPDWLTLDVGEGVISGTPEWYDYSPNPYFISIGVKDKSGAFGVQEYGVSVTPLNFPPEIELGEKITVVIDEDEFPRAWNDLELVVSDPDTDVGILAWLVQDPPSNGIVNLREGNPYDFLNYKPDGNFTGIDTFTLQVYDSSDPNRNRNILFEVVVQSVEDAPIFKPLAKYTDAVIGYNWEYEFEGIDGDVGQSVSLNNTSSLPEWLKLEVDQSEGHIKGRLYGVPNLNHLGIHEVELRVQDELGSGREQTVTISVIHGNFIPVIQKDVGESFEVMEEDGKWERDNPLNVYDENNQKLTWSFSKEASNGSVQLVAEESGAITYLSYVPDGNFSGQDSFTLVVSDGIASDSFTYFFDIPNINDVPLIFNEDTNISMKEGESSEIELRFNDGDGIASTNLTVSSELPSWIGMDLDNYDKGIIKLSLNPKETDEGNYSTTFTISDLESFDEYRLDVEVFVLNHAPVLNEKEINLRMSEDIFSSWLSSENAETLAEIEVHDEEINDFFLWQIHTPPRNGISTVGESINDLTYIPDGNFSGTDEFTVSVTDSGANGEGGKSDILKVIVTIDQVDDPPVFLSTPFSSSNRNNKISWNDESEYIYHVRAYDADWPFYGVPTLTLTSQLPEWLTFVSEGNASGYLRGLPTVDDEGVYRINFKVNDANGSDQIQDFLLHIIIDDYPPRFESVINSFVIETVNLNLKEEEEITEWLNPQNFVGLNPDPEPDDLKDIRWSVNEVSKVGSYLEVSGEGARPTRFFYTPPKDFFGSDEFSLRMSEGDRSSILKFKVDVTGVPDAPRFISEVEEMITVEEGTPVEIHLNAVDPDGDNLKFQLISPVWDLDPWIELVHGEKVGEILLTGTPVVSANGNFFPYRVLAIDETGRFDQLAINFRVEGYNRKPSFAIGNEVVLFFNQEGNVTNLSLKDLIAIDPEGEPLAWEIPLSGKPRKGLVELVAEGEFPSILKYFPENIGVEEDEFLLRVSDGAKFEDITVIAKMVWEEEVPKINVPKEIKITEGEAFFYEVTVGSKNNLELFVHSLANAPEWVTLKQLSSIKAQFFGEAPLGSSGSHIMDYTVRGERTSISKESIIMNVTDGLSPIIKLKGKQVVRISSQENFSEPGFSLVNANDMEDSLIVERIVPQDYDGLGFKHIQYIFADSNISESITRRTIKQYDEFPFKVNSNHLTLSKDKGVGLNWSRGESINIWNGEFSLNHQADHQIESNNTWRTFSSNYLSIQNHQLKHTLSGRNLLIFDVVEKENSNLLIAGVFEQTLSVGNREIRSSEARSGFVLEMNNDAKVVWVKTFGGDVEFDNFQICLAGNDEMTLAGSFVGTMHVQEKSTSLTSGESLSSIFLLSFDMDGKITDAISTDKGNLSLVRIHESNGLIFITANDLETSNSAVKSVVVVFNDNFSTSDIFDLESSSDLQINDSCLEQGTLFIAGYYNGLFSYNQSPLTESSAKQGFILGINLEDSKMPLQNAKFFESTIGSSVEAIASDYWGDLFFGLSFEGQIKLIDEHLSEGGRDLLLAKMVGDNFNVLYGKQIGGVGNDEIYNLETNSVGNLLLGLQSEFGFVYDGINYLKDDALKSICVWTFTSNLGVPEIQSQKLELKDKEPFFYKVESIHASDVYYEILSMPDWISYLPQEKAMNAARFFINPNLKHETDTLIQKPFRIRGFNLEGDFQDIEIEITKAEEDSIIFGEFPQYDTSFVDPLVGEGKILKFEENNGNWVYVVNEVDSHLFEFDKIPNSKKKFSTIKILNDNQKLIRSLDLISNEQVSISDALLYSEGAHFLCGNFKGELNVGEKIYRSQGGYDFFLLELNYDGEITNFKIFGGSNDDFVRCIDLLHDQIILGGEFSSSTWLHGKEYQARGSNDYFLLSLDISKSFPINWVRVFDDEGSQSLTSLTTSDSGDIFICAATSNEGASVGSEHNLILRRTNSTGIFEREYILTSNGRLRNGHLKWNPYHNNLILIGEFENQIIMNNKNATSKGGFDIFLCSLDYSLRSRNLISIGGPLNDRISAFAIESDEFFLIAGTFYDSLSIGNNYLISEGSSDAFILKFDYEDFIFGDVFKQGSSGEDRIDAINVKSPNEIYFAGLSSHTNNPILKDLFLSRFYNQSTGPLIFGNYPNEIPCSRKFEFEIKSGLWSSESQKFHIRDYESEKAYKWLDISIDSQAGITISGISPNVPTEVPFDFQIVSNSGEELSVEFILKITNSSMDVPVILLPRPNEIFQFKESIISFAVTNMESVGLVEISSPPWVSLEKGDKLNEYELHFSPLEGTLGLHEIGITAVGLNGSMQHKKFPVKVMPNLASGSSSSSHVDSNGWLESWFGYFFVSDEGWSYHEEFGWIFINSPKSNTELWFWIPNLGWVWTNQSSALDGGLYLYLDEGSKWIFFKEKAYFDFSIDQWLSFENL